MQHQRAPRPDPSPTRIRLCVLGDVRVEVDGETIPIAGKLKHRILSRLALRPTSAVSADVLIDALWGESPPRTAKQSLHVHISHIRERLRTVGAESLVTTTTEGLYTLGRADVSTDAGVFEALVESGTGAWSSGSLRSARDELGDALALWGPPFETLIDDYGAMAQRQRLIGLHERAVDAYVETLIELGETDYAITLLQPEVAISPLRERPYEQLMRLHLAEGDRAQALAVFEHAEGVFRDQLGIEPSTELRALRHQVDTGRRKLPSPERAGSSDVATIAWERGEFVDLTHSGLFEIPAQSETAQFVEAVRAAASHMGRRVAHGRILEGTASPLSPLFELAAFDAEPGLSRSPQLLARLFDEISFQLVQQHFLAPVLILEGVEHARPILFEYLAHALGRPGPAPFTVLLLSQNGHLPPTPVELAAILTQRGSLTMPVVPELDLAQATFDPGELAVLRLLSCALLPASSELIARSSAFSATQIAAAVDRLVARRIITVDPDGRLGLDHATEVEQMLALEAQERSATHLAIARAYPTSSGQGDTQHAVGRSHHLLRAHPTSDWSEVAQELRGAVHYLETLGAYEDIIALYPSADEIVTWYGDAGSPPNDLPLLIALGRAHIRTGRTETGRAHLERCLDLARTARDSHSFGDALRALLEERAPQTLDDTARGLIEDALAILPDEPDETRVQLMTDMANSWYFEDADRARRWADDAVSLARSGAPATLARALTGAFQATLAPTNAADRLEVALEAQHWARRADSTETLVLALTYEANALMELGELRRADPPLRYATALAAEVQVPRFQWWAAAWTALREFATGNLETAEEGFLAAYELWPTVTSFDPFECLASQIAAVRLIQGKGAELTAVLGELTEKDAQVEYLAPAAFAFAQAGEPDRARELLDRLLEPDALPARHDTIRGFGLAMAAEAAFLLDAHGHAESLGSMLAPLVDVHATLNVWGGGGFYWGSLRHGYGLALALGGHHVAAREALEQAAGEQHGGGAVLFAERSLDAAASLG